MPRLFSPAYWTLPAMALTANTALAQPHIALEVLRISADDAEHASAHATLAEVGGATNWIEVKALTQPLPTLASALALQPGVYAQSAGNEGIRLSIRGSGINRATGSHGSGTFILLDGLPLTGPGGTPYELLEPSWAEHIEVYRGANGLHQGSLALGGAINIASPIGTHETPLSVQYERGSYGWQKRLISTGGAAGPMDYFVSLIETDYHGYQDHAKGDSQGVLANVGYQFSPALSTRFYLRYRETEHQTPGRITWAQIKHDPRAANPTNLARNSHRPQPGSTWLANKTTWQIDQVSTLEFGLAWHHYPMDLHESTNRLKLDYEDLVASLAYSREHTLFAHPSQTRLLLRSTYALPNQGARESIRIAGAYPAGTRTRHYRHDGADALVQLINATSLTEQLWLDTRMALTYARREVQVTEPRQDKAVNLSDYDYAPSIGLRYQLSPHTQLFSSLSRSVEPAHAWSMLWSSNEKFAAGTGPASGLQREGVALKPQTATSFELGARGEHALGLWELTYYYAYVRNEHLSAERFDALGNSYIAETNATPTLHQGLEAALDSSLAHALNGEWRLRQAYTYNRFRYRNDPTFDDNALPGLPEHRYQGELSFTHASGWYGAVNLEYSAKVATDYANSFYVGSYPLLGARAGYNSLDQRLNLWLEARNLTNERYASTVLPGYNDKGADMPRSSPGEGRGFYAGIRYNLF